MNKLTTKLTLFFIVLSISMMTVVTTAFAQETGTIFDFLNADAKYSILVSVLEQAELEGTPLSDILNDPDGGPYTLFAPTNSAFEAIDPTELSAITDNPDKLLDVLTYHVLTETVGLSEIAPGTSLATLQGGLIQVTQSPNGTLPLPNLNDTIPILAIDFEGRSNGVVHTILGVLQPSPSAVSLSSTQLNSASLHTLAGLLLVTVLMARATAVVVNKR